VSNPTSAPLRIQLVTFSGCPNASAARALIESAVADAGIVAAIEEVDTLAPDTPAPLREWGSPTILLNGADVGGEREPTGPCCRLYRDDDGRVHAVPSRALLSAALNHALE
jgi:hypothetical protein